MGGLLRVLLLGLSACVVVGHVIELDERFANEDMYKHGSWLVMFYAPWCGYCRKLKPVWEEVSESFPGSAVHVARVDVTAHKEVAEVHGIEGMPTIKMFQDGLVFQYEGKRDVNSIVEFSQRVSGPPVATLSRPSELKAAQVKRPVFFTLFTKEGRQQKFLASYTAVAGRQRLKAYFYHSTNADVQKYMNVTKLPTLLVDKSGKIFVYSDSNITEAAVEKWILEERFPIFPNLDSYGVYDYIDIDRPLVFVVVSKIRSPAENRLVTALQQVARSGHFSKYFYFASIDELPLIRRLLLRFFSLPYLVVWNFSTKEYYPYQAADHSTASEDDVVQFLQSVVDGEAQVYGGNGIFRQMYRIVWLLGEQVTDVYQTEPFTVGLLGVALLLCLGLCCCVMCAEDDPEKRRMREEARRDQERRRRMTPAQYYMEEKRKQEQEAAVRRRNINSRQEERDGENEEDEDN